MKKILIVSALIIAMTGISTAQADDHGRGQGGGNHGGGQGDQRGEDHRGSDGHDHGDKGDWHDHRDGDKAHWQEHRDDERSEWHDNRGGNPHWKGQRFHAPSPYYPPHGYLVRRWHDGDRLPYAYRERQYYVDYHLYDLSPPPRGYRWVRVDNDVVLAAITTGVIMSVITGMYY
jgi:Ni/Co efflux regulator RcnB